MLAVFVRKLVDSKFTKQNSQSHHGIGIYIHTAVTLMLGAINREEYIIERNRTLTSGV